MSACAASTAGGLTVGEEAGRALDETTDPARMPGASGTVEKPDDDSAPPCAEQTGRLCVPIA